MSSDLEGAQPARGVRPDPGAGLADRAARLVDARHGGRLDTGGRLTVLHGEMAPHLPGPSAHVHAGHDGTFVVTAGRVRFRIGNRFHTAVPGEAVHAGRGLAHGFANPHDEPARYEDYFRAVAEHIARTGSAPGPGRTAELMARHRTVLAAPLPDPGR